jgi:hypothetical protein
VEKNYTTTEKGSFNNGLCFSQISPLPTWQQVFFLCRPYGLLLLGQKTPSFWLDSSMVFVVSQI